MESIKIIQEKVKIYLSLFVNFLIQFEPDKAHEATKTVKTVEDALESIKSIEQSVREQIDDIGEPEQPVRRSVCFDQAQDEKKAAIIKERVWDKNYDDTIMLCKYCYDFIFDQLFVAPMKRVQFASENGSKTNLLESKHPDIDLNFEDSDDGALKNEHYVSRETILAQSKPKGRKSKQK